MTMAARYSILAVIGLVLTVFNPLIQLAASYNQEIAVGGTAIYASLRGLSSVMSIVRDADVQASIGVASIATSPGQALQPVIGTIERMANLLFALVLASGAIGLTLPIIASLGALVLAIGAGTKAFAIAIRKPPTGLVDRLVRSCITLGILAAVCIPTAYSSAFFLGDRYTADAWKSAAHVFEQKAETLSVSDAAGRDVEIAPESDPEASPREAPPERGSTLEWFRDTIDSAVQGSSEAVKDTLNATTGFASAVRDQVAASTQIVTDSLDMATDLFQASIDIGVAYLVKLIILPLLILTGIIWLFQSATRLDVLHAMPSARSEGIPPGTDRRYRK